MFEAYKVATTLSITNKVSSVLSVIASDFAKTDRSAKALVSTLKGLSAKQLGLGGAILGGTGLIGLKMIQSTVKPAEEYVHQLELAKASMKNLAPAQAQLEIAQMTAAAWKTTSEVMTTTPAENLKTLRELKMVFGDSKDAIAFLPQMQRLSAVLNSTLHGQGGVGAKDVAFTAAKMLELRGASMNPKTFQEQADLIARAVIASGGKVTPQMLLMSQKYGGIGATSYSNDFMYGMLPTLAQELGGSSTGTALTSMYRAVVGGRMDKRSLAVWQQLGLADTSHADIGKDLAMLNPHDIKGSQLFKTNPFQYVQDILLPALVAHGITSQADQSAAIDRLFSNRTAGRIGNILGTQGSRLEKDFNIIGQAGSTNTFNDLQKKDPVTAWSALSAQWETLKTSIGITVVPIILPAMRGLTVAFNTLGNFLQRHPTLTSALTYTFAGLSGLALIGGGLMIAGAALKLIGAPLGLMAKLPWTIITTGFASLTTPLTALAGIGLAGIATGIGLIGGALTALAAIVYHKEVANWIDKQAPGIGDSLLAMKDWLSSGQDWKPSTNSKTGFAPPTTNGRSVQVNTQVNLDGRQIASVVSQHQANTANSPLSTGSGFDGRLNPQWGF